VQQNKIGLCQRRIAEEERLGASAATPEEATAHFQLALLYKAQLNILLRSAGFHAPEYACELLAA
jgi:hypothetical protein